MSLGHVSLLFLLQLAFGSMLTFAVNDRRALGPKYFKVSGWILVALLGLALTLVADGALAADATAAERLLGVAVLAAAAGMLLFSSVAGWDRPRLEAALLWLSLLAAGAAVVLSAQLGLPAGSSPGAPGGGQRALVVAGALGSSLVLGFTTWGMILGHWYLVAQGLPIGHLGRLVRPLPWLLLLKTAVSALALLLLWEQVLGGHASLDELLASRPERVLDVVNVWARIPVGLLVPAVMAWMTLVTVRLEKTQPATGILYAMCVTVYLGDLMGKMVEGSTGVPL